MNRTFVCSAIASIAIVLGGCTTSASTTTASTTQGATGIGGALSANDKRDLAQGYRDSLQRLYDTTPGSRELVAKAAGVLIFPRAVSAGFIVGGEYGKGELRVNDRLEGYYSTTSGSIGLQIGAQSRALFFLFMTQDALNKFRQSNGWSAGADASVAVLKIGANGSIDSSIGSQPVVGFVLSNSGLMANLSVDGSKISRIQ